MSNILCKGGCGNLASSKSWCKLKWQSGKRFAVACPIVEKKRGKAISLFRMEEAKLGNNPMQNPDICKKNHSLTRNKRAADTLRNLGKAGLLPQQVESKELREKRRKNNQLALKKLWKEGKHPLQSKSKEERERINKKIAQTLDSLASLNQHPSQLWTEEKRKEVGKKASQRLRAMIKNGKIKLSPGWKKVPYQNHTLRSNWEKLTAQFLDHAGIKWEYETLIIPYFDTKRNLAANTIPDFYLPKYNAVIEVKSNGLLNSTQTKDKMDAIKWGDTILSYLVINKSN